MVIWWDMYTLLVGGIPTPLKNMTSSVGMMTFPIYDGSKPIKWIRWAVVRKLLILTSSDILWHHLTSVILILQSTDSCCYGIIIFIMGWDYIPIIVVIISLVFHIIPMVCQKKSLPKLQSPCRGDETHGILDTPGDPERDWIGVLPLRLVHGIEPMSNQCLTNVPNIQTVPGRKIETPHDESNSKFLIVKPIEDLQAIDGHSIDSWVRSMGILWLDWLDTQGPKQPSCDFTQPAHEAWERTQQTRAVPQTEIRRCWKGTCFT